MRLVAPLVLLGLLAGCGSASPDAESAPAPASPSAAAPTPSFADLSRPDVTTVVQLHDYDAGARSAVVEPTNFMQGTDLADFCAAYKIPEDDQRCHREWNTDDSNMRVTLPVAEDVELLTVRGGNPECIDQTSYAGTCPAEEFDELSTGLLQLTTSDGTVTKMAELYTP